MAKDGEIALMIINEQINSGVDFSFIELQNKILNNGGSLRISPCFSVGKYILELEEQKIIRYDRKNNIFKVIKSKL